MKIIYLHQYFNTPTMHGGTRSYELSRRLVEMGHEVHMVTSDTQPAQGAKGWRETNESGIHVHWLPVPYSNAMTYADRMRAFGHFAVNSTRRAAQLSGRRRLRHEHAADHRGPGDARLALEPPAHGLRGEGSLAVRPHRGGRAQEPPRDPGRPAAREGRPTRARRTSSRSRRA